ncbi:MFS transporter [Nocardia sp. NEAU-G5]|uniref:MFS transporter n=1 Tax=Nocardia albiluteola TaxID=2842303 RepID=A0ABS6AYP4_9NOCA|nr:MFS transporter [Nocardia albiluteola]MBU3063171.1 MFS transporter [Nocardia albiluteola]
MVSTENHPGTIAGKQTIRSISRYTWLSLAFLWVIYALNANSRQMIFYVLPAIIKEYHLGPTAVGFLSGSVTAVTALLAIPAMMWADRGGRGWRRKYRHLPFVAVYGVLILLTGLSPLTATLGGLVILQLASHAVAGASEAVEVTSAAEWWPRRHRGIALGMHHTAWPWGTLIGGFAIAGLLSAYGSSMWRMSFLLFPIPLVIVFASYWRFATKRRYEAAVERFGGDTDTEPVEVGHGGWGALRACLANPNISIMAVLAMFATVGYIGLSFWLPQYLTFVAGYNMAKSAALSVLFTVTGGLGMIGWGWISDRLGRKLTLIVVFLWLAVAFCFFKYTANGMGWLVGVQLFAGVAINAPYTLVYAIAIDSAKKNTVGVASSIIDVGLALGGGAGPLLVGLLIGLGGGYHSVSGYNAALYVVAGLMAFAAVVAALLTRETTGWFRHRDRALSFAGRSRVWSGS